jgi:dipeptidyl aminopeptidase/acylaminoacyl peptidase
MRTWPSLFAIIAAAGAAPASAETPVGIPVEALFSNPVISSPVISLDGKTLAFVQSQGDLQVILSRPVAGDAPKALAKFDDPGTRLRWIRWASDDRLLISGQARSPAAIHVAGRETRMFAVDADGSNFAWLGREWPVYGQQSIPVAYQDQILHLTPGEPKSILLSYRSPYESSPMVMELDVNTGRLKRVEDAKGGIHEWHADGKGMIRAAEGMDGNRYQVWTRQDPASGFEKVIDFRNFDEEGPRFAGFHEDPRKIYVRALHEGRDAIFEFDLAGRHLGSLIFGHPAVDVDGIERDAGPEAHAIGVSYTVDRPGIHFLDDAAEREYLSLGDALENELGFPVFQQPVSMSADGNRQVLRVTSERQPPVFYFYDRNLRMLVRLFEQRPSVRSADLAPTRRVDYVTRDGLAIPAYLTLPIGVDPKGLPAIALIHGGPWSRDWIDWDPEVQLLASRGYAVLQINFRGSSGYGKAHLEAGYREWGRKIQDDITDGVKWLIGQGIADPDRIGIAGTSYGGYATLVGLVETPEFFRAGAAYAPVTDIELLISDDKWYDWGYEWHQTMIGGERGDKSRLRESSPLRRAAEIEAPVLIGHGTDDQRVHVRQSRRMAEALRKAGKDVLYLEFPDEIHGFLLEANRIRWYSSMVEFFDRNLAPRAARP